MQDSGLRGQASWFRVWGANSHGARPVHLIISMIKWVQTSRLSIENSLSGVHLLPCAAKHLADQPSLPVEGCRIWG